MKSIPHITRMDMDKHSFDGWNIRLQFMGVRYQRYVSDKRKRSRSARPAVYSLREAKRILKELKLALETGNKQKVSRVCKQENIKVIQL